MIPQATKKFIDNLIDYYINEAASYKQLAESYSDISADIVSTAFGIIVGCIYSGFLQAYVNQKQKPSVQDTQEFTNIIKLRAGQIKKSLVESNEQPKQIHTKNP